MKESNSPEELKELVDHLYGRVQSLEQLVSCLVEIQANNNLQMLSLEKQISLALFGNGKGA
jgi:hypothetical protein